MAKRGPKVYKPDWAQIEQMCLLQCTGEEIAGVVGVDYKTLERACKRENGTKFGEWIAQKGSGGKISLRKMQYDTAKGGNATMQIWLGKNWLGQTDRQEEDKTSDVENLISALSALSGKLPV